MYISVLPDSDTPAYKQIYEQISGQILSGAFPPGSVLPPIRAVANEIGTSVVTVRSAWELLEKEGFIETRAGSGCYVRPLSAPQTEKLRENAVLPALKQFAAAAKKLGLTYEEAREMLEREMKKNKE